MTENYLIIKCGYEGIDRLVYLTSYPSDAIEKINLLRKKVLDAIEKKNKIFAERGEEVDENFDDIYDRMLSDGEIEWEEYNLGKYEDPDSYCIQKWDGESFKCVCDELKVSPSKSWLM